MIFTTQNRIVQGVWIFSRILEKFDKNLIKYFLTHSQNFSDSSRCLVVFTDTVWILGPHGQARNKDASQKY